jgi:hypothetical protein
MSASRFEVAQIPRLRNEVVGEPITAHKYKCNQCNRATLVETNGILTIKSHHDNEAHATAIPVNSLFKDYVSRANYETVKVLERIIATRLAGLGSARAKSAVGPRVL